MLAERLAVIADDNDDRFRAVDGIENPSDLRVADKVCGDCHTAAAAVFEHAFVDAMRPAMMLAVVVVLMGAVVALTVLRQTPAAVDSTAVELAA